MPLPITTNVPPPIFGPNGFIPQTDDAILTGCQQDLQLAFGGNLNFATTQATPQGQIANSEAAIAANTQATFCLLTAQMDPARNFGRYQDAIARIYYLTRNPALPTVVDCECIGAEGTVIPAGSTAIDESGNIYSSTDNATIPAGGMVVVEFACITTGPIACPATTLNRIYQSVSGWDTVNNPADGILGKNVESRSDFEARRAASVAANARGTIQAVQGAVWKVTNVLDVFAYQNDSGLPLAYRGVVLVPHSIYVAVVGGSDLDVATAIWSKKAPGCAYNGTTTVLVEDTSVGYSIPYPSYYVTFQRPAPTTIKFLVSIADGVSVPSDATTQIQNAIINAFSGGDGGQRASIGGTIYASRFICSINALGDWVKIVTLKIGRSVADQNYVTLNIDEAPVTSAVDIVVTLV